MLGYEPGALEGRTLIEITPGRWHPVTTAAFEQLLLTGSAQRYQKEYIHRDGRFVPVSCVTDIDRDESDRMRGFYAFVTDTTESKAAEEALRASEERFRELYDDAPFGYHVIDATGTILSVNRTECELLGYDRDEMLGQEIFDFIDPSQREEARRAVAERVRGDRPVQAVERIYRAKNGQALTLHIENRLLRDREGRVIGIRSTVQDITNRKETEAALVASERRLRALFEGIEDVVFVHDLNGHILDANPAAGRRLGYTHSEFLSLNTAEIDDSEFSAGFEDRLEAQLLHGHLSCEGRHRTKDGRYIPVDINTSTIQYNNQTAVLAVIRDITERKALEETRRDFASAQMRYANEMEERARALARSEGRYRQLSESLLDALVAIDLDCRITLFNRAAEQVFGYEKADILGQELSRIICDEAEPLNHFCESLLACDSRIVGQTIEAKGRRKDGEVFPLEISISLVETESGREFIASIRDLTERHRMRAMLMQSEKLASIGLLSAGVAHEINNPLAFIANNLAVLERDVGGMRALINFYEGYTQAKARALMEADVLRKAEELSNEFDWPYVRDNLDRIMQRTREGVQRVATIVGHLRGLARTAPPRFESAALSDILDTALEMIAPQLKRGQIQVSVERRVLPKIACVPAQISQVMINLFVNAIQAMEEKPRPDGHRLSISLLRTGNGQSLVVRDTGGGIAPENIERIFDPFYTSKPVGEGTGLGLAISHGIVTGHGGRISVESTSGVGTTFTVMLPETSAPGLAQA
jgi:PAS domain S-box-containing protein